MSNNISVEVDATWDQSTIFFIFRLFSSFNRSDSDSIILFFQYRVVLQTSIKSSSRELLCLSTGTKMALVPAQK